MSRDLIIGWWERFTMIGVFLSTVMGSVSGKEQVVSGNVVSHNPFIVVVGGEKTNADCEAAAEVVVLQLRIEEMQKKLMRKLRDSSVFTPQGEDNGTVQVYVVSADDDSEQCQQEFKQLKETMEDFLAKIANLLTKKDIPTTELKKIETMIENSLGIIQTKLQGDFAEEKNVEEKSKDYQDKLQTYLALTKEKIRTKTLSLLLLREQTLKVNCGSCW